MRGLSSLIGGCSYLVIPLGSVVWSVACIALWRFLFGLHLPTFDINQVSLRQSLTPDRLQGRMNATIRAIGYGAWGIGPLIGGALATWVGVVPTLLLASALYLVGSLPLLAHPVLSLRDQPLAH